MKLKIFQKVQILHKTKIRTNSKQETLMLIDMLESLGFNYIPMGNKWNKSQYNMFKICLSQFGKHPRQFFAVDEQGEFFYAMSDFHELSFNDTRNLESLVHYYKGKPCIIRRKVTSTCYRVEMLKDKMLTKEEINNPYPRYFYATINELL